ncbi:acyltransferase, partial [Vibrio vulnificus]|nr:acyltransferase [Vibrio vulnificus]
RFLLVFLFELLSVVPTKFGVLFRYVIFYNLCAEVGKNVYIARFVVIKNFEKVKVGDNVSIHEYTYIDGLGGIEIGSNVSIAHSSSIISFEHVANDNSLPIKYNELKECKIVIEDDVWVGCGSRILSGSRIGERVILAAGSISKGELESGALYAGVPVRFIKKII